MLSFVTPNTFDLRAVTIMGMNAKLNAQSAIGYFGTGLKYALAVLAREGCQVTFRLPEGDLMLRKEVENFRGKTFEALYLGPHQLPFTTELGKNWTALMAYRELVANTRDEGGKILDGFAPQPFGEGLAIVVVGEASDEARARHSEMFLDNPQVIEEINGIQFCEGHSNKIFYKGVNVAQIVSGLPFTVNFISGCVLTEDRTWRDTWNVDVHLRDRLRFAKSPRILNEITTMRPEGFLAKISWMVEPAYLGPALIDHVYNKFKAGHWVPLDLLSTVRRAKGDNIGPPKANLDRDEIEKLETAKRILLANRADLSPYTVTVVDKLDGYDALAHGGDEKITLARAVLAEPLSYVIGVLYEEYCHLAHHLNDESRRFQDHLCRRIGALMLELDTAKRRR